MSIDLAAVRADTAGCATVAHFNNAGASLPPRQVVETVIAQLRSEEAVGGYEAAAAATDRLEQVYRSTAALIGAAASEIALVESATRAWDLVFYGLRLSPGDRVLVDRARYPSHALAMIRVARRRGAVIELVDNDASGQLDLADLERRLDAPVALAALTWIPTDSGVVHPMAGAGVLCRAAGVPLLVDGCQAVGQLDVDVEAVGCDMLTATGRKFLRGPRGTGFLYLRSDWLDRVEPLADIFGASWDSPGDYRLRPDARRFEGFERSWANQLGLGAAVDYALSLGMPVVEARIRELADVLRDRLSDVDRVRLDTQGVDRCGIVTFVVEGLESSDVHRTLADAGINTSLTKPQSAAAEPGTAPVRPRVRASVHYYNSVEEIDALVHLIEHLSASR